MITGNSNDIHPAARVNLRDGANALAALWRSRVLRLLVGAVVFVGVAFIVYTGWDLRTEGLRTPGEALVYLDDYDEGVDVSAAQLFLQGATPYRDYFYAHPPLGILVLAGVLRFHFVPWGDNLTFVLARYASVAFSLVTLLLVFVTASRLGGWLSGLVAAGTVAVDVLVVEADRRALFEPLVNLFSTLAILVFLVALTRDRSRRSWLAAAGAMGAAAALVKTSGAVALGAISAYCLLRLLFQLTPGRRRASLSSSSPLGASALDLAAVLAGASVTVLVLAGWFLFQAPADFLRQVYLFQLVRPPDGITDIGARFWTILTNDDERLTICLGLAGAALVFFRALGVRQWGQWGLILLWTALTLLLFGTARTFYLHYCAQLAIPIGILAGALVSTIPAQATFQRGPRFERRHTLALAFQFLLLLSMFLFNLQAGPQQLKQARDIAGDRSTILLNVGRFLATKTPPSARVLTFLPALNIVSSRAPIQTGRYLIDSFGYMQYVNQGLEQEWLPRAAYPNVTDAMRDHEAQAWIIQAAAQADYVVMDDRGRLQLTQETIYAVRAGRRPVYRADNVTVWGK